MKPTEINKIRELISLFYSGESTPQEESELRAMLDSVEEAALPEDLRDEKRFMAELDNVSVPEGLEKRLSATIDALASLDENKSSEGRSSSGMTKDRPDIIPGRLDKWKIAAWWCSSVAAAVILVAMFVPLSSYLNNPGHDFIAMEKNDGIAGISSDAELMARRIALGGECRVEKVADREYRAIEPSDDNISPTNKEKYQGKTIVSSGNASSVTESHIAATSGSATGKVREITDPEEAQAVMNRAFSRVYRTMTIAQSSIDNASRPLADNARLIENILQTEENL